jgi:cyclopropane-fatty-acyl-phospholipid synthase
LEWLLGRSPAYQSEESPEIAIRSSELMEAHYNMPLEMFTHFLGGTLKYSMGLWEAEPADLDAAQLAMMDDLCRKADFRDGMQVLDIGCGFGSLAAFVLRNYPHSKVTGLTLSRTQADYIRARQNEAGHPFSEHRFSLIEADFNDVSFDHPFDRVVSLGVFEHISNMGRALEKIRDFIAGDGLMFLHYIIYRPLTGEAELPRFDPFMDRYIFPGGRIYAYQEIFRHQRHFRVLKDWFINGNNYRRTVQAWLDDFRRNLAGIRRSTGLDDRTLRLWELYLRACVAYFGVRGGIYNGNGQYLLKPV